MTAKKRNWTAGLFGKLQLSLQSRSSLPQVALGCLLPFTSEISRTDYVRSRHYAAAYLYVFSEHNVVCKKRIFLDCFDLPNLEQSSQQHLLKSVSEALALWHL